MHAANYLDKHPILAGQGPN